MEVSVRLYAAARQAAGVSEATVRAGMLNDVLAELEAQFPDLARVIPQCSYLVNEVACKDLGTEISAGDTVDVLPPFAGG